MICSSIKQNNLTNLGKQLPHRFNGYEALGVLAILIALPGNESRYILNSSRLFQNNQNLPTKL